MSITTIRIRIFLTFLPHELLGGRALGHDNNQINLLIQTTSCFGSGFFTPNEIQISSFIIKYTPCDPHYAPLFIYCSNVYILLSIIAKLLRIGCSRDSAHLYLNIDSNPFSDSLFFELLCVVFLRRKKETLPNFMTIKCTF